ncbi:Ig-like domain-containing protein, partial [Thalassoroseus pseudoceratinae]|uniref:Ig-like domain-containing protein n=1 Tax=Thalassoroseus pseudoceratinae TaxID=2713176 RepID=UPI00141FF795
MGGEFLVNTFTSQAQDAPDVAMDGQGNYVVVWQDWHQTGSGLDVYAQRFAADGTPLGSEFQVNNYTIGNQWRPSVAMAPNGNFVVLWDDGRSDVYQENGRDGSGSAVYGQLFAADGSRISNEFRVNQTTADDQFDGQVGMDDGGNFVVTWTSYSGSTAYDVYARRYDAAATPLSGEFRVNTATSGHQSAAAIDMESDGDFVVTYGSPDADDFGIRAQRFSASGSKIGSEIQVNGFATGQQHSPDVAIDENGNFVVVWRDGGNFGQSNGRDGSGWGVYAQRFNSFGSKVGGEFRVNTTTYGNQWEPVVEMDNVGNFTVAWQSGTGDYEIFFQYYDSSGLAIDGERQVNETTQYTQNDPAIAIDPVGNTVFAWESYTSQGYLDVMARQYAPANPAQELTLTIAAAVISEADGAGATTATLVRGGSTTDPLTVNLSSDDASELAVPATVVFAAGQSQITFPLDAVDDTLLDGIFQVTVTASADGYVDTSDTIYVVDFETLSLSIVPSTVTEGGPAVTATVTRNNTDIDDPITVQLDELDNPLDINVPSTVTIPAGQSSTTFSITAFDDLVVEPQESARVFADASGYAGFIAPIDIVDNDAAPFLAGNILVSADESSRAPRLTQYTTTGSRLQEFTVPSPGDTSPRDVIVDRNGNAQIYNGTFDPRLSTLDPATAVFSHQAFDGWSTVNNVSYGGIAAYGDFVFASDTSTGNPGGSPRGIVRFDSATGTANRFAEFSNFYDLTIGLDGYLYGFGDNNAVYVLNPVSMEQVRQVVLPSASGGHRAVTANADGEIFTAAWDGKLYHFAPDGTPIMSLTLGGNLTDIDIRTDGAIVVGSWDGDVFLTDDSLQSFTSFDANPRNTSFSSFFVAFTDPLPYDNHAPSADNQSFTVTENSTNIGSVPASDPDGDNLTYAITAGNEDGVFEISTDGAITVADGMSLDFETNPQYVLTVTVTDDGTPNLSDTATVIIQATNTNDNTPVANDDQYSVAEDNSLSIPAAGVLANDSDADGDALSAILVGGPSHGSLTLDTDGSFVYTPNADFNGTDSFTYRASDGTLQSAPANVTITVIPVDDGPIANPDSAETDEDTPIVIDILANDFEPDGEPLIIERITSVVGGTVIVNPDNTVTFSPAANFNGNATFSYNIEDPGGSQSRTSVTITVLPVNDAPVAADDAVVTNEDQSLVIQIGDLTSNDFDIDGDSLTVDPQNGPSHGILVPAVTTNGFIYSPLNDFFGTDSFTYLLSDGNGGSDLATVTITVNPVNDAPVANDDAYSVAEDGTLTVTANGIIANDVDVDGDTLVASLVSDVTNGSLTLNANGSFDYTPNADFDGTDSFTYLVNDGTLNSSPATVTIQ